MFFLFLFLLAAGHRRERLRKNPMSITILLTILRVLIINGPECPERFHHPRLTKLPPGSRVSLGFSIFSLLPLGLVFFSSFFFLWRHFLTTCINFLSTLINNAWPLADRSVARSLGRSDDRSVARSLDRSVDCSVARWLACSVARSLVRSIV